MANRARPSGCWTVPLLPVPLAAAEQVVAGFRALADPTRLEIFRLIAAQAEPICVCDIVGRFDVSQPTISHHLKVLREAGLVTWEKRGLWVYYSLNRAALHQVPDYLGRILPASKSMAGLGSA